MWKYVTGTLIVGSVSYGLMYNRRLLSKSSCCCTTRLDGLVVVITGGTKGIGRALSVKLLQKGATLVLACPDLDKGIKTKREIVYESGEKNAKVFVKQLDLASIASILKFSDTLKSEFQEIYALVNNAQIIFHPHTITEDGFEITYQTNYLGTFILTHNLLPLLKKADHSRIINTTNKAHRFVNSYDLKAITKSQTEFRSHLIAYGVSKLALILFTRYLHKKLLKSNVIVNAADPGFIEGDQRNRFLQLFNYITGKSAKQGAQTILHCILTSNRSTGQYYRNCKLTLPSALASNEKEAQIFYELTLEILHEKFSTESDC